MNLNRGMILTTSYPETTFLTVFGFNRTFIFSQPHRASVPGPLLFRHNILLKHVLVHRYPDMR